MSEAAVRAAPALDPGILWIAPPLLVFLILFFYLLALIFGQSFIIDSGAFVSGVYATVLGGSLFRNALFYTIEIALMVMAGCVVLGFTLALVLTFVPFFGGKLVAGLIDTFIALSTFLVAFAFTFIYGSAGLLN